MRDIGRRWVVDGLGEAGFATLAHDLKPSELWSLLLGVMEQRSRARSPAAVRQQWESDRFVHPAPSINWLHALTANHKMSFVASGMGAQLAAVLFRTRAGPASR